MNATRLSSEEKLRKESYKFTNKINRCLTYQKTQEEKEEAKRIKSEHKRRLKGHYKEDYNRKIHNLPQYQYGML